MVSPIPKLPYAKSGGYVDEVSTFTDISSLMRYFATRALRASLSSPPLAKDVDELTLVYDKTLNRIYTKSDGTLRYVQFT